MKVKKSEILIYLSYICLYISLFLGDVYDSGDIGIWTQILRWCSYFLIIFSCIYVRHRKNDFIKMFGVFILTLLYAVKTEDLYWSILVLLIYNLKKIDIEKIFKISVKILAVGISMVLIACILGILPDILTTRNTVVDIAYNRHSFGFYHSNVLPLLIFYLEVYYICLAKENVKRIYILCFMLLSIVVNSFCNSRNALILSIILSCSLILWNKRLDRNNCKGLYWITTLSIPAMSIFSVAMTFLLLKGGVWNSIDTIFSGRFRLAIFKIRRIGIHLINIMSNKDFVNDNVTYVNGVNLDTIVLDNGYLYVMLRYGILIIMFYIVIAYLLAQKNKENGYALITLISVLIINFVDNDLVDYSFLPFILWAFNEIENSINSKLKFKLAKGANEI